MRRLIVFAIGLCLTGCYTTLKQTRAPVAADCNQWPLPSDEGDELILRLGQVGRFGELKILFADLELNAGGRRYYYQRPYPRWGYGPAGYPPYADPYFYGPRYPVTSPLVDVVYLSICSGDGSPTDRKFQLSRSAWFTDDTADVGPYTIQINRLRLEEPPEGAPSDSAGAQGYWERMRSGGVVTVVVSREP